MHLIRTTLRTRPISSRTVVTAARFSYVKVHIYCKFSAPGGGGGPRDFVVHDNCSNHPTHWSVCQPAVCASRKLRGPLTSLCSDTALCGHWNAETKWKRVIVFFKTAGCFLLFIWIIIMNKTSEFQEQTRGKQNRWIIRTEARDYCQLTFPSTINLLSLTLGLIMKEETPRIR
jgi:hypothetical protein